MRKTSLATIWPKLMGSVKENDENEGKDRVKYATGVESARKVRKMMININLLQEIPSDYSFANRGEKKDEVADGIYDMNENDGRDRVSTVVGWRPSLGTGRLSAA